MFNKNWIGFTKTIKRLTNNLIDVIVLFIFFNAVKVIYDALKKHIDNSEAVKYYNNFHDNFMKNGWTEEDENILNKKKEANREELFRNLREKNKFLKNDYTFDGQKTFTVYFDITNTSYEQTIAVETDFNKYLGEIGIERINYNIELPFIAVNFWIFDIEDPIGIINGIIGINIKNDENVQRIIRNGKYQYIIDLSDNPDSSFFTQEIVGKSLKMKCEVVEFRLKEDSDSKEFESVKAKLTVTPL